MKYFRIGWVGAMIDDAATWCAERSEGAKSICVPFSGSGRAIATMAQTNPGATIRSFDMQLYCDAFVRGIFGAAEQGTSNVYDIRLRKGTMFEERFLKGMPDECAGYFDWIAKHGTLYDIACLGSTTIRSTMVGRMTHWSDSKDVYSYHKSFCLTRERLREWVGLDAKFDHSLGSVFDYLPLSNHYDIVQVDPPKVTSSTDVYSGGGFAAMNRALGGPDIMVWRKEDVVARMDQIMNIDGDRFLFFYTTGVKPTPEEMKRILQRYGVIEEEVVFPHAKRDDIAWLLERRYP